MNNTILVNQACDVPTACQNGGECKQQKTNSQYTCSCLTGYTGDYCETGLCTLLLLFLSNILLRYSRDNDYNNYNHDDNHYNKKKKKTQKLLFQSIILLRYSRDNDYNNYNHDDNHYNNHYNNHLNNGH